jgi:uncharacterized protein YdhG (YjbR/CyaY superfamily)
MAKPKDVDAYIASAAPAARPLLHEVRKLITSTIPKAEEGISYGVPFYKYQGGLAGFAVYKNHVSFGGADVLSSRDRELLEQSGYATGKKTVQIKFDQNVPAAALKRILKAQAQANEVKRAAK